MLSVVGCGDGSNGGNTDGNTDGNETSDGDAEEVEQGTPLTYLDDMSKIVSLSRSDYEKITVKSNIELPNERDVDNKVIGLLYANKASKATENDGDGIPTVQVGDTVGMFYRGYYIEDGERVYFDGGCNFSSSEATLGIGSGRFIIGFELGLIGQNAADHVSIEDMKEGSVAAGDILSVSYELTCDGKTESVKNVIVDLSQESEFGDGFYEYLIGSTVSEKRTDSYSYTDADGRSCVIGSLSVDRLFRATRSGSNGEQLPVLTVEAYFDHSYSSKELACRTAFFEVYITSCVHYETPSFDDNFITETLGVGADDLADFDGDTLTEKYRAKILSDLNEEYESELDSLIMNEVVEHCFEKAQIIALPEAAVDNQYYAIYTEIKSMSEQYSMIYPTLDEFAVAYLGLESGADWRSKAREYAQDAVARQAAFYLVGQTEGYIPEGEELERLTGELYSAELNSFLEYYGIVRANYKTDAAYNTALATYTEYFESYYDMNYFRESAVFGEILNGIKTNFVTVVAA